MKKSLINLMGASLLGLSAIGCASDRCRTIEQPQPEICAPVMASSSADENSKIAEPKPEPKEDKAEVPKEEKKFPISAFLQTEFKSQYVGMLGIIFEDTPVEQSVLDLTYNLPNSKNSVSAFQWENYNFNEGHTTEVDRGASLNFPITEKLKGKVGAQYWEYRHFASDSLANVNLSYSDKLDLSFDYYHFFPHGTVTHGDMIGACLSKTFPVHESGDLKLSLTPRLETVLLSSVYGMNGIRYIRPGISAEVQKGKLKFEGYINQQFGIEEGVPSPTYGGVRASAGF
jgi:hypothetical protein